MEEERDLRVRSSKSCQIHSLISRALVNDGSEQSLDAPPAEASSRKLIKINLNPRILLAPSRYGLEKASTAEKCRIITSVRFGRRLVVGSPLNLRLRIRTRQEEVVVRLWRNLNGFPREQDESIAVEWRAIVNPDFADGKRQIFRLVDERHTKDTTMMA